ncbi:IS701 family transposase [Streptomyces sp. NPDC058000]|uniref:IS701 family transposase n=1 Tax=Streptomyces sp. NPDC058000 TaxID=3346299 RepID=UPI0036E44B4D
MAASVVTPLPGPRSDDAFTSFVRDLFAGLPRADQRRWAQVYLGGLLSTPGKKSIRHLAAATGRPAAALSLQQFVNSSPWDWQPVRTALLRWAEQRTDAGAWTIGLTAVPKRGEHSAGVHRRFVPTLGRTINCQAGLGAFLSGPGGHVPVDWRLLLPGRWSQDEELRSRARIPADHRDRPLAAQVLGLVDSLAAASGAAPLPVVADMSHERDAGHLLRALAGRRYDFVVAVPPSLAMTPFLPGVPAPGGQPAAEEVLGAGRLLERFGSAGSALHGSRDGLGRDVQVLTCLVRLPGFPPAGAVHRLFAPYDAARRTVTRIWVTSLAHARMQRLLSLASLHDLSDTMDALADDFGLSDFEGRSYPGWHHHTTLASAACAFSRLTGDRVRQGACRAAA